MSLRTRNKRLLSAAAATVALSGLLAGCGGKGGSDGGSGSKVVVWYLWGGPEGQALDAVIQDFNASQKQYVVEGLSVPDEQKIKVAIAGGNGPDLTDSFSSNVAPYAEQGIALPLDDLIARDKYNMDDFLPAAAEAGKYKGKVYALPLNVSFSMMYYNKKLLAEAGFKEPPKTSKELMDVAIKTTKTRPDGTIEVLGSPQYPSDKFLFGPLAYGFGTNWVSKDATRFTFDAPSTLEAFRFIYEYNKRFGADNVKRVQASGKWLDPNDPFFMGKQAIRFDGPWMSAQMKSKNINVDYGIAPLPYLDGKPETAGGGENSSSVFYIAKTAKNKEGAWAFMKFLYEPKNLAKFLSVLGNVPAQKAALDEPAMKSMPDYDKIMELSKSANLRSTPNYAKQIDFGKIVEDELDQVTFLKKTPEEAVKSLSDRSKDLLK
ncbi:ABC transporter substrate-binding protein [Paenibacillus sp. GYB003]|uniref:ABC transporter substrate-binding protein n=1 Tax=Paenibacillus sp. GYB003 TaxID=2994392 RepID=UPI002F96D9F3